MDTRKEKLTNFYTNKCEEDVRLDSRHGHIEFLTTTKYIDKYLKPGDKILEVGAGTGKYSLHYAAQGYDVYSIEFVEHNINIFKEKIKDNMHIQVEQGDALDLSRFDDNAFDITLVLGPLYHLFKCEEINKVISEALRVTKKGGIIAFSYLTADSIIVDYGLRKGHLVDKMGVEFDENFKLLPKLDNVFNAFYIKDFKNMVQRHDIKILNNVATDGISRHMRDIIKDVSEEEYNSWIKYHLLTCEREELQGYSSHMLYIGQKESFADDEFLDTSDLNSDEIFLKLTKTCDAQPEKGWVMAYYFDICLPDETVIGCCNLRIGYNEQLYYGGNIGYAVNEQYRGHHYAAKACKLLFKQAQKHNMPYLIITCDPANIASSRTCEIAGGKLLETIKIPEYNEMYSRGRRNVKIFKFPL